jgi:hypothetical protein
MVDVYDNAGDCADGRHADEVRLGPAARARDGGGKFYLLKFRVGGKQRWNTIGRHGSPWTPE